MTGGAVLGDRVRMANKVGTDVFIRSFASRGLVGGLARVVPAAIEVVAAAGFGLVIVETVGVGQSEIEVASTTAVTAGVMEIADVFVVNKCDLPEAGRAVGDLRATMRLRHVGRRDVPVLKVSAATGERLTEAWSALALLLREARNAERPAQRAVAARADELATLVVEHLRRAAASADVPPNSILGRVIDGRATADEAAARVTGWLTAEQS